MQSWGESLVPQASQDLARRAGPGIALLPLVFVAMALPAVPLWPSMLWSVGISIGLVSALRIALTRSLLARPASPAGDRRLWAFGALTTLAAILWSFGTITVVLRYGYTPETYLMIIGTAGVSAGAVTSLNVSRWMVLSYCLVLMVPLLVATVWMTIYHDGYISMPFMGVLYIVLILVTAERANREYWSRLLARHQIELQQRVLAKAHRDARAAAVAKTQFLASMSHEIRTPMNGVMGAAQLLRDTRLSPEQAQLVRMLESSGRALLHIIDDILDFSKIEAGRMKVEDIPFDLFELVDDAAMMMGSQATTKGLSLEVDYATGTPQHVRGDPTRIRQILLNLLSNAIKFTEVGGIEVKVMESLGPSAPPASRESTDDPPSAESEEERRHIVRLEVHDTGPGVPPESRSHLFKAFSQADASTTRRHGGTGLGLAISKRLCLLMNGTIGFSPRPGGGSVFWFSIGFAQAPAPVVVPKAAVEPPTGRPGSEERPRILIVEDNQVNQLLAARFLERAGFGCEVASSGEQALRVLENHRFDAVLMDCQMPGMDGLATTRAIRQQEAPNGPRLPIVALTADAMDGTRERCLDAGMDDFLTKPVQADEMAEVLHRVLSQDTAATYPSQAVEESARLGRAP